MISVCHEASVVILNFKEIRRSKKQPTTIFSLPPLTDFSSRQKSVRREQEKHKLSDFHTLSDVLIHSLMLTLLPCILFKSWGKILLSAFRKTWKISKRTKDLSWQLSSISITGSSYQSLWHLWVYTIDFSPRLIHKLVILFHLLFDLL